jgi:hypothetical protein
MAHQSQITFDTYSTHTISETLLSEITEAIKNVSPYGSVEIYVQDNIVTQITVRNIKKTTQNKKSESSRVNTRYAGI